MVRSKYLLNPSSNFFFLKGGGEGGDQQSKQINEPEMVYDPSFTPPFSCVDFDIDRIKHGVKSSKEKKPVCPDTH